MANNGIGDWDRAAKTYSEWESASGYSAFCREFIAGHFADVKDRRILDAGCGGGQYTHILSQNGGDVVGCDGSREMLKLAKAAYPSCRFDLVDLLGKMPYANGEFELIFCNLVLMDIDPIDKIISEFYRLTRPGGVFFFSIVHPAFYRGAWETDERGHVLSKKVTGYCTPSAERQRFWGPTMHYHRPIFYYFNRISAAGFSFWRMFEPKTYEDAKIPDIPLYLFAEFRKP